MKKRLLCCVLTLSVISSLLLSGCFFKKYENEFVFLVEDGDKSFASYLPKVQETLEKRLDAKDIEHYKVTSDEAQGTVTVRCNLSEAHEKDEDEFSEYLSAIGMLTFRPGYSYEKFEYDENGDKIYLNPTGDTLTVLMDGSYVDGLSADLLDDGSSKYHVTLRFNDEGAKLFENITTEYLDKVISIWIDDRMIYAGKVEAVIDGGEVVLPSGLKLKEIEKIGDIIQAGIMPCRITRVKKS